MQRPKPRSVLVACSGTIAAACLAGCGAAAAPHPTGVHQQSAPHYTYRTAPVLGTVPLPPTTAPASSAKYTYMGMQTYRDAEGEWLTVKYYSGTVAKASAVPAVVAACSDQALVHQLVAVTGLAVVRWHVVDPPMVFNFDPVTTMQPVLPTLSSGVFDTALSSSGTWICSNSTYPSQPGVGRPLKGNGTFSMQVVSLANILSRAHPALTPEERAAWDIDPVVSAATGEQLQLAQPAFTGPSAALCPAMASEDVGPWRLGFFAKPPYELRVPPHGKRPAYLAQCNPVGVDG